MYDAVESDCASNSGQDFYRRGLLTRLCLLPCPHIASCGSVHVVLLMDDTTIVVFQCTVPTL